ncbi:GerW family sporulation protein [Hazenella coriacea]|nr:GerW family sporulation protein [Hazenella coriacea]
MQTAMENIKEMVDVNTIIGDPVETPDGQVIIPVSRVGFGFAAGGSEFTGKGDQEKETKNFSSSGDPKEGQGSDPSLPFGGGSGGGVSITPVAFIVVGDKGIRLLNMEGSNNLYNRLIDVAPTLIDRISGKDSKKKESHCQPKPEPPPCC